MFYLILTIFVSADSVPKEQSKRVKFCMSGEYGVSKALNSVPHDIGDPGETLLHVPAISCFILNCGILPQYKCYPF